MPAEGAVLLDEESVFDVRLARLMRLRQVRNSLKMRSPLLAIALRLLQR